MKIMYGMLMALTPAALYSLYAFGLAALARILTGVISAVAAEAIFQKLTGQKITVKDEQESVLAVDWSYLVPKDNYKKEAKLPTTYTEEEIERMLSAVDRGNPKGKRDYAMLLLACRLGLRASDICGLSFANLLWQENLVVLTQEKTKKRIELPLLAEVGNAIIDYLKCGRPVSQLPYIFLHAGHEERRLAEPTLHSIVSFCLRRAGLPNVEKKKHEPHALRHSLAGFLLQKKTPLAVPMKVTAAGIIEMLK